MGAEHLKPWKPGQSGNPSGGRKIPEDIQKARVISQFEFERIVNRFLFMPPEEIAADLARTDEKAHAFEHLLGGIILKAIRRKDFKAAEWLLSRTLGKMRERLEIESKSLKVNVQAQAALPSIEQLALENPDLTQDQLESFAAKLQQLKREIAATREFEEKTLAIPAEVTPVEPD